MPKLYLFVVCLLMATGLLTGCRRKEAEASLPRVEGKTVVMIIAARNFRDEELQKPKEILENQGAKVTLASSTLDVATGMLGAKVTPHILVKDIKVEDYDAIVFVGGIGAAEYWEDPVAHRIAKEAAEKGKLICAICIAPVTLANAGVLSGRRATVFPSEAAKLKAKGANYTGARVEQDGNIITASGPEAAREFGEAIVRTLAKR